MMRYQEAETDRPQRPSFDEIWMKHALLIAKRSTCLRAQNGAVLVDPAQRAVSSGYNGSPRGTSHCTDPGVGCLIGPDGGCVRTIHAELNAVLQSRGSALAGGAMYCTTSPCYSCAIVLVQVGVSRVVFAKRYRDESGLHLLVDADVELCQLDLKEA